MGGWVEGRGSRMGTMVSLRLCLHRTVALPILRGADTRAGLRTFSFAAAEAGRAKTRAAGYSLQTTDSRLQTPDYSTL